MEAKMWLGMELNRIKMVIDNQDKPVGGSGGLNLPLQ